MGKNNYPGVVVLSDMGSMDLARKAHEHLAGKKEISLGEFNPEDLYIHRHRNGEYQIRFNRNVRKREVFMFLSPLCLPLNAKELEKKKGGIELSDLQYNPDSHLAKARIIYEFLINDARGAAEVTFVMAHQPYQRQDAPTIDRRRGVSYREPISCRIYQDLVNNTERTQILTVAPHFKQIRAVYKRLQVVSARTAFSEDLEKTYGKALAGMFDIAPDSGAVDQNEALSYDTEIVYIGHCGKKRSKPGEIDQKETRLFLDCKPEEIEKRSISIGDDMIDSGGTLVHNAKKIYEFGAGSIDALIAHGILTDNAAAKLRENDIRLVTTDSIAWPYLLEDKNARVISLDYILGEACHSIITGDSTEHLEDYKEYKRVKKEQGLW